MQPIQPAVTQAMEALGLQPNTPRPRLPLASRTTAGSFWTSIKRAIKRPPEVSHSDCGHTW
eukprot:526736-Pelagomonas_calceolata.AAC.4